MKGEVAIVQNVAVTDHRMVHTDGIARELMKRGYDVEVVVQADGGKSELRTPPYELIGLRGDTYSVLGNWLLLATCSACCEEGTMI